MEKIISFKYKDIYNKFIDSYKKIHINPFHEISEYELEKGLFNRRMMFSLPSLKDSDSLIYEFITLNGEPKIIKFDKNKN